MDAERAIAASGLKQIPRAIAFELLLCSDGPTRAAQVHVDRLVTRSGWGRRIILAALARIEATGLIERIRTRGASIYRWSLEAIARLVRPGVVKAARAADRAAAADNVSSAKLPPRSPNLTGSAELEPPPATAPGPVGDAEMRELVRERYCAAREQHYRVPAVMGCDERRVSEDDWLVITSKFARLGQLHAQPGEPREAAVGRVLGLAFDRWMRHPGTINAKWPHGFLRETKHPFDRLVADLDALAAELSARATAPRAPQPERGIVVPERERSRSGGAPLASWLEPAAARAAGGS